MSLFKLIVSMLWKIFIGYTIKCIVLDNWMIMNHNIIVEHQYTFNQSIVIDDIRYMIE